MATRNEKLQKINAELEAMSDDELSMVAGGTKTETANDSRFLNSLNGSCDRYGEYKVSSSTPGSASRLEEIKKAWSTVGIEVEFNSVNGKENLYFLDDMPLSQEEARQHAMKVTGHYMTEKDWKW